MPYVGGKRPKTDRMLNLVGDWLFAIVNSPTNSPRVTGNDHSGHHKKNNDGVSDGELFKFIRNNMGFIVF